MAAPVAAASNSGVSAGGDVTVTKPTDTADGDLLICGYYTGSSAAVVVDTPTLPAGWTQLGYEETATGRGKWICGYRVASSEGASYTFADAGDETAPDRAVAFVVRVTGANTGSAPIYADVSDTTSETDVETPTITTLVADTLVLRVAIGHGDFTWTNPANHTTVLTSGVSTVIECRVVSATHASPGATGTATFIASAAVGREVGATIGIGPVASNGGTRSSSKPASKAAANPVACACSQRRM